MSIFEMGPMGDQDINKIAGDAGAESLDIQKDIRDRAKGNPGVANVLGQLASRGEEIYNKVAPKLGTGGEVWEKYKDECREDLDTLIKNYTGSEQVTTMSEEEKRPDEFIASLKKDNLVKLSDLYNYGSERPGSADLNMAVLDEIRIKKESAIIKLGSLLHEEWRQPRYREITKDYEPRIKKTKDSAWMQAHGGATEVDIANTPYEDLPSEWQGENKSSAEVAVTEVVNALYGGVGSLNESFIETASSTLHDKWLERNGSWAPPEQKLPYSELSEEEKEKDRVIIRKAT